VPTFRRNKPEDGRILSSISIKKGRGSVFLGDALILFRRLGVDVPSSSAKKADNGEQIPGGKIVERGHELRCIRAAVRGKRLRRVSLTFARHYPSSLGVRRVAQNFHSGKNR
jgi:hypothetical protein